MASCDKENFVWMCDRILQHDAYANATGIRLLKITDEGADGELILSPNTYNGNRDVHGGALFTLADTVSCSGAYVWGLRHLGENFSCTTTSSSFHYLRPVQGGEKVFCHSTLRKTGRTLAVSEVSVVDEKGVEVCCGIFSVCFIDMNRYQGK